VEECSCGDLEWRNVYCSYNADLKHLKEERGWGVTRAQIFGKYSEKTKKQIGKDGGRGLRRKTEKGEGRSGEETTYNSNY